MNIINKILRKQGYIIKPYPNGDLLRRKKLINHFNIDLILDVGASTGEYALNMRRSGYQGKIISFEPINKSFQELKKRSNKDPLWSSYNYALGEKNGEKNINISINYDSSSLLKISDLHTQTEKRSKVFKKEEIEVNTLDTVFPKIYNEEKNIYLKMDTQGYEKQILDGASKTLSKFKGIQLELSLTELYEGSHNYKVITEYLENKGFNLYSLEPGFYDKFSGQLLQFDGIFFR
jgi:FkbM family methyltransferase